MEFDNTFAVEAPIDEVYRTVLDLEKVAPCVPGAEVLEQTSDTAYKVGIKVKVGPISMTYRGDVEVLETDDAAKLARMRVKARESRGQGTADANVTMSLSEDGGTTTGAIHTDVKLSGKVAAMGGGVIKDVSSRIIDTFSANLQDMLGRPAEAVTPEPESPGAATGSSPDPQPAAVPPPPGAAPATDQSLPVGAIAAGIARERLLKPPVLAGLLGVLALLVLRRRK